MSQNIFTVLVVCLLIQQSRSEDPLLKFNCVRDGCSGYPCNINTGICDCPDWAVGNDCSSANIKMVSGCGGYFTAVSGTLRSPNYPDPYNSDETCNYFIRAPDSHKIKLTLDTGSEIQPPYPACPTDSLKAYDGWTSSDTLLITWCSPILSTYNEVTSNGNVVYLKFETDSVGNLDGWELTYVILDSGDNVISSITDDCPSTTYGIPTANYLTIEGGISEADIPSHSAVNFRQIYEGSKCICLDPDFDGDLCATPRIAYTCSMTGITITRLDPADGFSGNKKLYEKSASCIVSDGVSWEYDHADCPANTAENPDDVTTLYPFVILIQYDTKMLSSTDILLTAKCQLSNGASSTLSATTIGVTLTSSDLTEASDQILVDDKPVATLVISANAGTAGGDVTSLNVGQDFYLVISMPRSAYVAFLVDKLEVLSGDESQSEIMVSGGCWTEKAIKFIKGIFTTDTSSTHSILSLKVTAFKFTSHNQLKFKVTLLLCTTSASGSTCELTTCVVYTSVTGADTKLGHNGDIARRKRDVQGVSEAVHSGEMTVSVNINQPGQATADGQSQNVSESRMRCLQDVIFLAPLVTLMALLLLSMGTAFYFCSKVNRRNKADPADDYRRGSRGYPMSESGRSGHSSKYPGRY